MTRGVVACAIYALFILVPSFVLAQDNRSDHDVWPYFFQTIEESKLPSFVSACTVWNDPHLRDGYSFVLIINGNSGSLFRLANKTIEPLSGVRYDPNNQNFRLEDPVSGMWTILSSSDIMKHLSLKEFHLLSNIDIQELSDVAELYICDIAYVSLHLYDRFYEHVDSWTGETLAVAHVPDRKLDARTIEDLKSWRNIHGMPWSAAGHGPDLTDWEQHSHSVRLGIAGLLTTIQAWQDFTEVIRETAELEGLSALQWAQRHISQFAGLSDRFLLWDSFAWFTAPYYETGSLPLRAEKLLEQMARGAHLADLAEDEKGGFWVEQVPVAQRLPDILKSLEAGQNAIPPLDMAMERWIAGFDVRYFLDRRKLELQRLGAGAEIKP